MRLWSIHPRYLDSQGLVALWREALLARAVLRGQTRGYRHHPQLERFRAHGSPRAAISAYLGAVLREADARGFDFDARKVGPVRAVAPIPVTRGQLAHEWQHLLRKLARRSPSVHRRWRGLRSPACHPLMRRRSGGIEPWERLDSTRRLGSILSAMTIRGGCLCGAVAFEIHGRISPIQTCLCSRCRKASGSAFGASLLCATKSFAWVRGQTEITTYQLSSGFLTAFCRVCGSPLPTPTTEGKVKAIPAGCLDGDSGTRILRHTFVGSKADWFELTDALPRHDEVAPLDPPR